MISAARNHVLEISSSIDGTELARSLGFVVASVMLTCVCFKCTISKEHVSVPSMKTFLVQSKDRCFPFELAIAKETTKNFTAFEEFFNFMGEIETGKSNNENNKPVSTVSPNF